MVGAEVQCPGCHGPLEVDGEGGGWCERCQEYWPAADLGQVPARGA